MSFRINPVNDIPEEDAKLLGHDKIVTNLKTFFEKDNMITPLSIAIHGDWGSGKTSIMKTLANKLSPTKFEVVFFEAWKYEYANPSLGLISELIERFTAERSVIHSVLTAAVSILSNQYLGLDIDKIIPIIHGSKQKAETLSKQLHGIIKHKLKNKILIIIIDDLDRCDVENTLQLLAIIKLFLDIKNCVCIAAVDFNRLKQAWKKKYADSTDINDGSEYLDKIFQIRIGIARPPPEQLEEYVKTLVAQMPKSVARLFSMTLPKNPRAIKRILNLVSFRQYLLTSHYREFSAIFWTLLEDIISNEKIIQTYDALIKNGTSIGELINRGNEWQVIKNTFDKMVDSHLAAKYSSKMLEFFALSDNITKEFSITKDILNADFKILYAATNEALK